MAFTSIAALVAGSEMTGALVLGAIAEAGTVMSIAGAVTGNSDLMKIGGVMSLGAGVAGFAGIGAATSTVDTAADMATSASSPTAWNASGIAGSDATVAGASDAAASTSANSVAATNAYNEGIAPTSGIDGAQAPLAPAPDPSASTGIIDNTAPLSTATGGGSSPDVTQGGSSSDPYSTQQPIGQQGPNPSYPNTYTAPAPTPGSSATGVANSTPYGPGPNDAMSPREQYDSYGAGRMGVQAGKSPAGTTFDGIQKFLTDPANRNMIGQLGSGAMSGMGKAYEADRNYQINRDLLTLKQTQQGWGNSTAKYNYGIVNGAKG